MGNNMIEKEAARRILGMINKNDDYKFKYDTALSQCVFHRIEKLPIELNEINRRFIYESLVAFINDTPIKADLNKHDLYDWLLDCKEAVYFCDNQLGRFVSEYEFTDRSFIELISCAQRDHKLRIYGLVVDLLKKYSAEILELFEAGKE
jgi:hypothetical protein